VCVFFCSSHTILTVTSHTPHTQTIYINVLTDNAHTHTRQLKHACSIYTNKGVYMHAHVHIRTHAYTRIYTYTHMHMHARIHTHTHTLTSIHTHTHPHPCVYIYTGTYTHRLTTPSIDSTGSILSTIHSGRAGCVIYSSKPTIM